MKYLFVGKSLILTPKRRNRHNLERMKISTGEVSQGTKPTPTLLNFNSPSGSQINACYYHLYYETLSPLTIITPFHLPWGFFLWSRVVCGFSRCGDSQLVFLPHSLQLFQILSFFLPLLSFRYWQEHIQGGKAAFEPSLTFQTLTFVIR